MRLALGKGKARAYDGVRLPCRTSLYLELERKIGVTASPKQLPSIQRAVQTPAFRITSVQSSIQKYMLLPCSSPSCHHALIEFYFTEIRKDETPATPPKSSSG